MNNSLLTSVLCIICCIATTFVSGQRSLWPRIRCPANLEYDYCGGCQTTCDNINKRQFCDRKCHSGCFCPPDLVFNKYTNSCVTRRECCPINSHFEECGSACPTTCKNMFTAQPPCTRNCVPGCVCNDGFVKNNKGECVHKLECMHGAVCPPKKTFSDCSERLYKTCAFEYEHIAFAIDCKFECECEDGFLETNDGKCVPGDSCPQNRYKFYNRFSECQRKDPNSVYKTCSWCNKSCFDRKEKSCPFNCLQPGCKCKKGYVKDPNGVCIEPGRCPIE